MPDEQEHPGAHPAPRMQRMTVTDLDQARLLTDPFRLRLIEAFHDGPRTTMQVAESLGENPTKLYRHVDALEKAGLLVLVEERKKRGTVERYLQTVARRFEVDPLLFAPDERRTERERILGSLFQDARRELLESVDPRETGDAALVPLVAKISGTASPDQIASLRQKLLDWIEECESSDSGETEAESFGGLIAFYGRKGMRNESKDASESTNDG